MTHQCPGVHPRIKPIMETILVSNGVLANIARGSKFGTEDQSCRTGTKPLPEVAVACIHRIDQSIQEVACQVSMSA